MKIYSNLLLLLFVLFGVGCTSINMNQPLETPVKAEMKADVEVGEKISATTKLTYVLGVFQTPSVELDTGFLDGLSFNGAASNSFFGMGPVERAKSAAAYIAVTSSGADVIVMPRYKIKSHNYILFTTVDITVEGYKGTIRSVKGK